MSLCPQALCIEINYLGWWGKRWSSHKHNDKCKWCRGELLFFINRRAKKINISGRRIQTKMQNAFQSKIKFRDYLLFWVINSTIPLAWTIERLQLNNTPAVLIFPDDPVLENILRKTYSKWTSINPIYIVDISQLPNEADHFPSFSFFLDNTICRVILFPKKKERKKRKEKKKRKAQAFFHELINKTEIDPQT